MNIRIVGCKECPDRSISPNCHNTCQKYKEYREEIQRVKDIKAKNTAVANDLYKVGTTGSHRSYNIKKMSAAVRRRDGNVNSKD